MRGSFWVYGEAVQAERAELSPRGQTGMTLSEAEFTGGYEPVARVNT